MCRDFMPGLEIYQVSPSAGTLLPLRLDLVVRPGLGQIVYSLVFALYAQGIVHHRWKRPRRNHLSQYCCAKVQM